MLEQMDETLSLMIPHAPFQNDEPEEDANSTEDEAKVRPRIHRKFYNIWFKLDRLKTDWNWNKITGE